LNTALRANKAASVRAKLLKASAQTKVTFDLLAQRYAVERLLVRLYAENPLYYEIGQKWLPDYPEIAEMYDWFTGLNAVQRGAGFVKLLGWRTALWPGGALSAFSWKAILTGPTPGFWFGVVAGFSFWDSYLNAGPCP
jgi:hypothetical protein